MSNLKQFTKAIRHEYSQTAAIRISKKRSGDIIFFFWKYKGTIHFLAQWSTVFNHGIINHADTNDEFQADVAHYARYRKSA